MSQSFGALVEAIDNEKGPSSKLAHIVLIS